MIQYVERILLPYVKAKRRELHLASEHPALVMFDNFSAQTTVRIIKLLDDNHVRIAMVPPNCTDRLQSLDVSVNKAVKNFLRQRFENWYATQVCQQLKSGDNSAIDLKMSVVKPLGAQWIIDDINYLKRNPNIVINGFRGTGIFELV